MVGMRILPGLARPTTSEASSKREGTHTAGVGRSDSSALSIGKGREPVSCWQTFVELECLKVTRHRVVPEVKLSSASCCISEHN